MVVSIKSCLLPHNPDPGRSKSYPSSLARLANADPTDRRRSASLLLAATVPPTVDVPYVASRCQPSVSELR